MPPEPEPNRRSRRTGRLGCLGRFVLFLVLGTVTLNLIYAVFAPWSFFLGGRFHPIAVWQGIGRMHASSGDYVVYFWISPVPGGRTFNFPTFRGWGDLCTPRGERLPLRVAASMHEHPGIDTNGKDVSVSLYRRPWYYRWTGVWDDRPRLEFRGRWQNPELVMNDGGTLSKAFLPDGTLYLGPARNQPAARETVQLVVHEAAWSGWFSDCRTGQ